jgi:hypothetical protein
MVSDALMPEAAKKAYRRLGKVFVTDFHMQGRFHDLNLESHIKSHEYLV